MARQDHLRVVVVPCEFLYGVFLEHESDEDEAVGMGCAVRGGGVSDGGM